LEDNGIVSKDNGFQPCHVGVFDGQGVLVAAAPTYLKDHSKGELITDVGWNMAYSRGYGEYYPKIQVEVPFAASNGPRLMTVSNGDTITLKSVLLDRLKELVQEHDASSLHFTYLNAEDRAFLNEAGLLEGAGSQFHWENLNYEDFDQFLEKLKTKHRAKIRKERRVSCQDDINIRWMTGDQVSNDLLKVFFGFYLKTYEKYETEAVCTYEFFSRICETMPNQVLFCFAFRGDRPVACNLCFLENDILYGHHWGCAEDIRYLHFEICYYQTIQYAIEHNLPLVDSNQGGAYKMERGRAAVPVYHAHWFPKKGFADLIEKNLARKWQKVSSELDKYNSMSIYK
jgi:predicted N-acyltransferase